MIRAQVYDVTEEYTRRGTELSVQGVRVHGLTKDGKPVSVLVTDIPHEMYVDPSGESMGILEFMQKLNTVLLTDKAYCRRTGCENGCGNNKKTKYNGPPCFESCVKNRRSDKVAVSSCDTAMLKGYEVYESEPRTFWKFTLTRTYYAGPMKRFCEARGLDVYDVCEDAVESFFILKNMAGFEWYEWPSDRAEVSFSEIKETAYGGKAPIRDACLDIEVIGEEDGTYKNTETKKGTYPICTVNIDDGTKKVSYVLDVGDVRANHECRMFKSELAMLHAVRDDLISAQVWSGWNSDAYDIPYIFRRGEYLNNNSHNQSFCKFKDGRTIRFYYDENQNAHRVYLPGVLFMDFCKIIKADTRIKPYDYKLETMVQHYEMGHKGDVAYNKIREYFYGTVEQRSAVVDYCALDTSLTRRVGKVYGAFVKLMAKSRVKRIRPQDEIYRGAAFVTKRKVQEFIRGKHVMISPRFEFINGERTKMPCAAHLQIRGMQALLAKKGYAGGFVREPLLGLYMGFAVATLDFNSLYPSLIRTYNMCPTTQLQEPGQYVKLEFPGKPIKRTQDGFTHVEVEPGKWEIKEWESSSGHSFVQDQPGITPEIMKAMVGKRNEVRAEMKNVTDPDELEQLEALQTEYKIVANSLYGQTGAPTSALFMKTIAQSTCKRGAELAQLACHIIDEDPRMPLDWTPAQKAEYTNRMQGYEDSLDPVDLEKMKNKRTYFAQTMGLKVIYGDTDSLMIWFSKSGGAEETLGWVSEVQKYINKDSGILGKGGILKMGTEDVACMLLCGKKMYVKYARAIEEDEKGAKMMKKPKMKIVGLDNRNKTPHVRTAQRAMVDAVFVHGKTDVSDIYEKAVQDVALGRLDKKQLKHTSELGKALNLYESQAHAVAARQMVACGMNVEVGDRIEYYRCMILNASKKKADSVVAGELIESEGYELDWKAYAEETINALAPFMPIIRDYKKLSDIRYYHTYVGSKRMAPVQAAGIVGEKRVLTPQAGPMDSFVKRTRVEGEKKKGRVHRARGREFSDVEVVEPPPPHNPTS